MGMRETFAKLMGKGDTGNPGVQPLTAQQRKDWNAFVDYLDKKGYKGSTDLDVKNKKLGATLLDQFNSENPGSTLTYDAISSVQNEMQRIKEDVQAFAKRKNDPNADKLMAGVSPVDGWLGSKTSQFKFPNLIEQDLHNDQVVRRVDKGLLGGGNLVAKNTVPAGAKLIKTADGDFYEDEHTGDLIPVNKQQAPAPAPVPKGDTGVPGGALDLTTIVIPDADKTAESVSGKGASAAAKVATHPVPHGAQVIKRNDGYYYQDKGKWVKMN